MGEPGNSLEATRQLVDRQLQTAAHTPAPWRWEDQYRAYVSMCPSCHCYSYVLSNGQYQGVALLVDCRTLTSCYDRRMAIGGYMKGATP